MYRCEITTALPDIPEIPPSQFSSSSSTNAPFRRLKMSEQQQQQQQQQQKQRRQSNFGASPLLSRQSATMHWSTTSNADDKSQEGKLKRRRFNL